MPYNDIYKINDKHRYLELYHFCMQYNQKKARIEEVEQAGGGAGIFQYTEANGRYSDPTANKAVKLEKIRKDCEIIEQTALEAAGENYKALLENITRGVRYETIFYDCISGKIVTVGQKNFYMKVRKKFFWILDQKL